MKSKLAEEVRAKYQQQFGSEPLLIRSPGRINLIGEHTDYNDGFVMPAAIDKEIVFAIGESKSAWSTVLALKYDQPFMIDISAPERVDQPGWANFLLGIVFQITRDGHAIKPFNCVFGGDVPLGAGLSSSAALECGFAYALNELFNLRIPKLTLVKMGQWAEHHYVGVKCGIMDQFASVMSKEDQVIMLDCRDLSYSYFPLSMEGYEIVLCDSKVKHSLVDSEYNTRRSECEQGVRILSQYFPNVKSLRDVSLEMLSSHKNEFPGKVYQRCLYVVEEIQRVQESSKDLKANNLVAFGKKMFSTHEGLSNLYQVSCPELDFLVMKAKELDSVAGARMMGGGFGGCTINIVKSASVATFIKHIADAYEKEFNIKLPTYVVHIREGTSVLQ